MRDNGIEVRESTYTGSCPTKAADERSETRLSFPELPDEEISIEELLYRRKSEFRRRKEWKDARRIVPVKVSDNRPIGIVMFGDPHVDDPGSDIEALERDVNLIRETPGLYGACIGDIQNNWVGRLSHLYGRQETTARQAWQLVEWFIDSLKEHWLFLVQGNHDHWSGTGNPLNWIQRQSQGIHGDHEVRISIEFPNDTKVRIAARHDWPGSSIWNPTHGQVRAATMTVHDHIVVAGHRHTGGYQKLRIPASQLISHCIALGAYKLFDDYAEAKAFPNRHISPSVTAIINPSGNEDSVVRIEHDTEAAASYLTWLRQRGG